MRRETVGETAVTGRVRMKAVGREERLAARAEHLVDGSARADIGRARGWVGGSTLAALVGGAPQAEHRLQCTRDTRHDRKVDHAADDGLDTRPIERSDHRPNVALELHERRRVNRVVGPDRHDCDVGPRVEDRRELMHQHVGDARTTHRATSEVHAIAQSGGCLRHENVARRIETGTGQGAVAHDCDMRKPRPRRRRPRQPRRPSAVVPGQVLVVEHRERCVGGTLRLHP